MRFFESFTLTYAAVLSIINNNYQPAASRMDMISALIESQSLSASLRAVSSAASVFSATGVTVLM